MGTPNFKVIIRNLKVSPLKLYCRLFGASYHPCGETHKAEENSGFLTGYHIDDVNTQKDENIEVIIWTDNNTDVHCTTELDMDNWETAKS